MLLEIFYSMIGNWARAVIEWFQTHPTITLTVFVIWTAVFFSGKYQLRRIESRTHDLVLEGARKALENNPQLSSKQMYELLYPQWTEMLGKTAWFVPHRLELWPIRATPDRVSERIDFTQEWLASHLWANGVKLKGAKPPKEKN
jgi:hypothetical protein